MAQRLCSVARVPLREIYINIALKENLPVSSDGLFEISESNSTAISLFIESSFDFRLKKLHDGIIDLLNTLPPVRACRDLSILEMIGRYVSSSIASLLECHTFGNTTKNGLSCGGR